MTKRFLDIWRESSFSRSLEILNFGDKVKFAVIIAIQTLLGLLDLFAVAIIGLLGALSVNGIQTQVPGERARNFLGWLGLSNQTFQIQIAVLGILGTSLFLLRTVLSVWLNWKVLYFLSNRAASISSELLHRLSNQSIIVVKENTRLENLYAVTSGVTNVAIGILGTSVTVLGDLILLTVMSFGLFFVNPAMAFSTFVYFSIIGFILYRIFHDKANNLGKKESELTIQSNEKIVELITFYRELSVKSQKSFYISEISKIRFGLAKTLADLSFMPTLSKYVIESSVIVGALLISAFQFVTEDAVKAIGTLSIFLVAGTRIAPAVLRIQQGAIQIMRSSGSAAPTFDLISKFPPGFAKKDDKDNKDDIRSTSFDHYDFCPKIELEKVSFSYPESKRQAIVDVDLSIGSGSIVAIVGPSGAGKSTLADLILGIIDPDFGEVRVSGVKPRDACRIWPGALAYVPQDVTVRDGSYRTNVTLGYPDATGNDEQVWKALEVAQLSDFVTSLPQREFTQVGDLGSNMSGGQRQRLGIARALFTNPKLLILDEATSALDSRTEALIGGAIQSLRGKVTVIVIAHRIATVREADLVVYLDKGRIRATGNFEQVRKLVKDFDIQAGILGLQ